MRQTENTQIALIAGRSFKFGLTQIVVLNVSSECGEIKARTQYADGENRYLIYYKDAHKTAQLKWFGESMLEAVYRVGSSDPVFAVTEKDN